MKRASLPSWVQLVLKPASLVGLFCALVCLVAFFLLWDSDLLKKRGLDSSLISTDGQLAFISDRGGQLGLYLMNADGNEVTRLIADADIWEADWSPDGRYLAYVDGRVEEADVYVLDVEAALQGEQVAPKRVTETEGFDGYPVWSPDGRWLAFGSIARSPAGTYLVSMTDFLVAPTSSEAALWATTARYPAAWSPDGSRLIADTGGGLSIVRADFSRIKVKGDGIRGVTLPDAQAPAWAPDGRRLVFERDGDLYLADGNGSVLSQLTDTPESEFGSAWSPDGVEIAYLSRARGNSDMGQPYVMPAPGLPAQEPAPEPRRLARVPADLLAWSPDSTRLAFYSNRGRGSGVNGEIWVMNRDGTGLTLLTGHPAFDGWPLWRPTGGP
jgi:Tol biopolymer transport system component